MKHSKFILKAADSVVSFAVILVLVLAGLYAGYALWDNNMVYAAVDDIQIELKKLKPAETVEDGLPSFEELLAINSDITGWVTIDNTNMDYPVVQGEHNLSYINRDIYGEFALAGSIFLDSRNDRNFGDGYSLLYGHSMDRGRMFGDVNLYKEEDFFRKNQTGSLLTLEGSYDLKIFASLIVPANEEEIFNPGFWKDDMDVLVKYAEESALYLNQDTLAEVKAMGDDVKILALTTCSYEFTDARTAILAVMVPGTAK